MAFAALQFVSQCSHWPLIARESLIWSMFPRVHLACTFNYHTGSKK
jgi:hypothetical protein